MRFRHWTPPVIWMALIYIGSTEHFSAEATGRVILPALRALLPRADPAQLDLLHAILRKAAHVVEYGILSWLWFRALSRHESPPRRRAGGPSGDGSAAGPSDWPVLAALAISVAYAALDELHQAWTGVRTGSVVDVLWDGIGAAAALGLLRFGWQAVVTSLTTVLIWIAAAGGTLLLLLHLLTGTPARWLWISAPLAWIALWGWHRRNRRPAPQS